jgi:hypothetical protein
MRTLLFLILLMIGAGQLRAQSILPPQRLRVVTSGTVLKLAWDPSSSDNTVGYSIYWRLNDHNYTSAGTGFEFVIGRTNTTVILTNLASQGVYHFVATVATDVGSESRFSNEASWTNGVVAPPVPPQRLRVVVP